MLSVFYQGFEVYISDVQLCFINIISPDNVHSLFSFQCTVFQYQYLSFSDLNIRSFFKNTI